MDNRKDNKKEDDASSSNTGSESKFATLSFLIGVADGSEKFQELSKVMKAFLSDLENSARFFRYTEKRKIDPRLEELIDEGKISYAGPKEWEADITFNTPFSSILANPAIKAHEQVFYNLVTEAMEWLMSDNGSETALKSNVFLDLMHESSSGKNEAILNAIGSGMLDGIKNVRKNAAVHASYTEVKLLMQNLRQNKHTAPYIKEELWAAWISEE